MAQLLYLRSFLAVYRHGSISKASLALNLTQPAISRHVQLLEQRLGSKLFERLPRGVAPTAAAVELEQRVSSHLDALEAVKSVRPARARDGASEVLLGTTSGFSKLMISALSKAPERRLRLELRALPPPSLLEAITRRQLEIAVTPARIPHRHIDYEILYEGPLVLVCAPSWRDRLARSSIPRGVPLIDLQGPESPLTRYWKEVFDARPDMRPSLMPDYQAAVEAAKAGMGLAVAPQCLCFDALESGRLIMAQPRRRYTRLTLFLAQHREAEGAERIDAVKAMLKDAARTWAPLPA